MQYKRLSELYFQEVTWENQRYNPSLDEHIRVSAISSGVPALVSVLMMGFSGDSAPTRADFEWFQSMPDMVVACGQVGRFINDMAAYTLGKKKKDVANTHECYMKEFGVTEEEAFLAIKAMAEHAWRTVNKGCLEMADNTTAARKTVHAIVVDLVRSMELIYLGGKRDAYTYGSTDLITSLYLKPVISA
jgi:eudesmane-5,11-diol synthase